MLSDEELSEEGDNNKDIFEYDSDGGVKGKQKGKIEPLPSIDHSKIQYKPFAKNIYVEHKSLKESIVNVNETRAALEISVMGDNVPSPITEFKHAGATLLNIDVFNFNLLFTIKDFRGN